MVTEQIRVLGYFVAAFNIIQWTVIAMTPIIQVPPASLSFKHDHSTSDLQTYSQKHFTPSSNTSPFLSNTPPLPLKHSTPSSQTLHPFLSNTPPLPLKHSTPSSQTLHPFLSNTPPLPLKHSTPSSQTLHPFLSNTPPLPLKHSTPSSQTLHPFLSNTPPLPLKHSTPSLHFLLSPSQPSTSYNCALSLFPYVKAARLTVTCRQLKHLGLFVSSRPYTYTESQQDMLDSFLLYTSCTNFTVSAMVVCTIQQSEHSFPTNPGKAPWLRHLSEVLVHWSLCSTDFCISA